jgi:hypothetical protein
MSQFFQQQSDEQRNPASDSKLLATENRATKSGIAPATLAARRSAKAEAVGVVSAGGNR